MSASCRRTLRPTPPSIALTFGQRGYAHTILHPRACVAIGTTEARDSLCGRQDALSHMARPGGTHATDCMPWTSLGLSRMAGVASVAAGLDHRDQHAGAPAWNPAMVRRRRTAVS